MVQIITGDALDRLRGLPDASVHCCVTSPPYYGLRDYGVDGQIGKEATPDEYIRRLVEIFREVRRVLRSDGTLWLNIGDGYAGSGQGWGGHKRLTDKQQSNRGAMERMARGGKSLTAALPDYKPKDLIGIPWMLAFALREDGWYLRQDIIWHKPNCMPESVKDRCTKSHEYLFLLSKSPRYYFQSLKEPCSFASIQDFQRRRRLNNKSGGADSFKAVRPDLCRSRADYYPADGMRNRRDVWSINTKPCKEAHFAVFPEALVEPCILAGCPEGGTVLDPFGGSGTTGLVAKRNKRNAILIEINPIYVQMAKERVS